MKNVPLNININRLNGEIASRSYKTFIEYRNPKYIFKPFNEYIISRLQAFANGEIKNLMIFAPPQHGKTQLTTRDFPAYKLGLHPETKIAITSYSTTIAHEFGRDIKNIIQTPEYRDMFPNTKIGKSSIDEGSFSDASYYYHTVPHKGFVYSVGRGGSITSKTIDLGIIDDPLKGREESNSLLVKDKLWKWYLDDFCTRLHNDSQQLLIQTRWVHDDLAGRILKTEADKWEVIIFPAIKTADFSAYDLRNEGEPLFPEKHSLERLLGIQAKNETSFNALYQQDPKPNKQLLVHPNFVKVDSFPTDLINKWVIGIDFGWNDPTVVTAVGCIENKRYWKTLLYMPGKEIVEKYKGRPEKVQGDETNNIIVEAIYTAIKNAGLQTSFCYSEHDPLKINNLRTKGLLVYLADKSIALGIEKVNEFDNYYLVDDLIMYNEVSTYQFKSIGELVLDEPVDGNDHIMNSGRYAIYTDAVLNRGR